MTLWWRGHDTIMAADFQPAWLIVASISALSCQVFWRMPGDAGAALAERTPELEPVHFHASRPRSRGAPRQIFAATAGRC